MANVLNYPLINSLSHTCILSSLAVIIILIVKSLRYYNNIHVQATVEPILFHFKIKTKATFDNTVLCKIVTNYVLTIDVQRF